MNIYIVDAFTDAAFKGNPAAVVILNAEKDEQWMQKVAYEMNLSETAFLIQLNDGFNLRWFTPTVEVSLCGHATLASAHILWTTGQVSQDEEIVFYTKSGVLTAKRNDGWIDLDFPSEPVRSCETPQLLVEGLGAAPSFVGKNDFIYLVELDSEAVVRNLQPDFAMLARIPIDGIVVTSRADSEEFDFVSRCFYPASGTNEDPVTGSAHCCIAPYWQQKLAQDEFVALQCSERTGVLRIKVNGERITLTGQAVTFMQGRLV